MYFVYCSNERNAPEIVHDNLVSFCLLDIFLKGVSDLFFTEIVVLCVKCNYTFNNWNGAKICRPTYCINKNE